MSLSAKRVVVLGGTSGIGFATARAAQREGASIIIASSRKARVDAALALLAEDAQGHVVDLANEAEVRGFFARLGTFDHLVFTAGGALHLETLEQTALAEARGFFDLRFWGAIMAAKYAGPNLQPGGSITLTAGIAGRRPRTGWTIAASICGAVEALTRALAVELAPIRVNAVSPGTVRTELWNDMAEADRVAMFRGASQRLPVGRIGEADDVAETYLYLMREGFSTGQVIIVDGGALLV